MAELTLTVLIVLVLAYDAWKDYQHRKQIDRLSLLIKAKDVPEFIAARAAEEADDEKEEPAEELLPLEEATPEEALAALRKNT